MRIKVSPILIYFSFLFVPLYAQVDINIVAPSIPKVEKIILTPEEIQLQKEQKEIDTLKLEIDGRSTELSESQKEIDLLVNELVIINEQRKSLENDLKFIEISNQKFLKQIRLTETTIKLARLKLIGFDKGINLNLKNRKILLKNIARLYQKSSEIDEFSLFSFINKKSSVYDLFNKIEQNNILLEDISKLSKMLNTETKHLYIDKSNTKREQIRLNSLQLELKDRQILYQQSVNKQAKIVSLAKVGELEYQKELKKKLNDRNSLQRELLAYESQLDFILDPSTIPDKKPGVLSFPLKKLRVTQSFGQTSFALRHPGIYSGNFHPGIDLAASTGTQVFSAAGGEVIGTGDTDLIRGCRGFGKWVLVRHFNGLTTLYAHLSLIKVKIGGNVSQGDLVGYSGNTGYSTAPHLHFGVYYSNGVEIVPYERISSRCNGALAVVAHKQAKLNPFDYLEK